MARRRLRSLGAIVISNPRRRKARKGRARRKNPTHRKIAAISNPRRRRSRVKARRGHRNPIKIKAHRRRKPSETHAGVKLNPRRHRRSHRRGRARRNPAYVVRSNPSYVLRSNPRKRRKVRVGYARHNPAFLAPITSGLRKLPVVGVPLADAVCLVPYAVIGAVALEVPLMATSWLASQAWATDYLPKNEAVLLAGGSLITAIVVQRLARMAKMSPADVDKVGVAVASAGAGAAYMSWKLSKATGLDAPMAAGATGSDTVKGLGALTVNLGTAYTVGPQGYGALVIGN
jgi:hypothetical protein